MARMHTRKIGKSKSRKPPVEEAVLPHGVKQEDIVKAIVEYSKQGMHQAQIGQRLKEQHSVPYIKHMFNKRLTAILDENGFKHDIPQDLMDLLKKAVTLRKHLERNHGDMHNKLSLQRTEMKIWRLSNYYKGTGKLPGDWKYDPQKVALIIKAD
ncbi:MAG: 30S ribosomal protein S15 [Candidatus Micrarchaeota archaeon]|nr:30S ribosomal protein S15 [Candidatus Micrarchaeota archaeon]